MPIFMQFSGITGDVQSVQGLHGEWIEIGSLQWGVGRAISSPTSGSADREGSTPSVSEIVVTKATDPSSPSLWRATLGGPIGTISIVFTKPTKPGSAGVVYHTISLTNGTIVRYDTFHPIRKGRHEKLTITFSGYDFNGLGNVPIPYTLIPPQGSQTLPVNEGGYVNLQEIWTAFRLTPAQLR